MEYNFRQIEKYWREHWRNTNAYKVSNQSDKPKFYVLDMFPYPSGAGLHVGHPLGYIASDIYARYKRLKGYNVLHPMGFDSFGLPAEQYAIETGQHPAVTTEKNIARYRQQLDNIGFCYDWSREVRTSDPKYYKWTQYIFLQLFDSWYNRKTQKAERINQLVEVFEKEGNTNNVCPGDESIQFSAEEWKQYGEKEQQDILMQYRLAYNAYGEVNWCEALGTVLANDEVVNGVSERGGHPVVKKKMRQWYLRITEYADRLLQGLETVDFSESMKEMQRNWIGKSIGAEIVFRLTPGPSPRGEGRKPGKTESGHFFKTADLFQWQNLKQYSRENRKNPTQAEELLWQQLRSNKLGVKVRRQHAIEGFIADFAIMEAKLVIEIDGGYHTEEEQKIYDEARTKFLKEFNIDVLRFTNNQVINNTAEVINEIKVELGKRKKAGEIEALNEEQKVDVGQSALIEDSASDVSLLREEKGPGDEAVIRVFTTRPDTIFGVDFMVLAPEHELVKKITAEEHRAAVEKYLEYVSSRSERERQAEVKQITGVFTGAYAINPFDRRKIPVWISEYVLAGYGTGAIMAVPSGDQRDFNFARHFNIPITNILGDAYTGEEANPTKDAVLTNSDFLNGMLMRDAIDVVINKLEEMGIGKRKINYRMRDAGFSRQRYWGEPFPIVYKDGVATPLDENELPLQLPYVEKYGPGPEGEGPLANIKDWTAKMLETNTMPGYAGSSWYFLRYMDPHNEETFVDKKAADYWGQVDLYIGGTEHAVGHLLYSRMWTKVLFDLSYINHDEPYKKLLNQGMIQGSSRFVYRVKGENNKFVSFGQKHNYDHTPLHVDVSLVDGVELNIEAFRNCKPEYHDAVFILEDGSVNMPGNRAVETNQTASDISSDKDTTPTTGAPISLGEGAGGRFAYICGAEVEKMSKSKYNVVNPDDIVERYGADTFRMYEMFLGPVEQSKPWDTKGIEGVHRFLRKFWRLFFDEEKGSLVTNDSPTLAELKVLHKTIKKIEDDTERFSFNTAVSAFMVCVNELHDLKCHKHDILEPLVILLTPYAPHIAEELYQQLRSINKTAQSGSYSSPSGRLGGASVLDAAFPKLEEKFLVESEKEYPISINGKVRTNIPLALDLDQKAVEEAILQNEIVQKWLEGRPPKKVIYVKGKMINVVV